MSSCDGTSKTCWICMGEEEPMVKPCSCPRWAHQKCIASWQLQKSGTREETHCRFCNHELRDWKAVWDVEDKHDGVAKMGININGTVVVVEAKRGPDGQADFLSAVREHLGCDSDVPLQFSFQVKAPASEGMVTLSGVEAFESAMVCALHNASKRKQCVNPDSCGADSRGSGAAQPSKSRRRTLEVAPAPSSTRSAATSALTRWLRKNPPPPPSE